MLQSLQDYRRFTIKITIINPVQNMTYRAPLV